MEKLHVRFAYKLLLCFIITKYNPTDHFYYNF